jgi:type II secretory pathway pseudopilin PulG
MNYENKHSVMSERGFSLIEVVLAIGIFLVTVLALVGLLGPTLRSINEVEKTDEVSSIVNTLNSFLQSSPAIALGATSKFDAIYNAVTEGGEATVYIYRWYEDSVDAQGGPMIKLEVGFDSGESSSVGANSIVNTQSTAPNAPNPAAFSKAAGTIYRAVLTPSSVLTSGTYRSASRNSDGVYDLVGTLATYLEGSFALEVRIFAEDPPGPLATSAYPATDLSFLKDLDPIFTYNTAVLR